MGEDWRNQLGWRTNNGGDTIGAGEGGIGGGGSLRNNETGGGGLGIGGASSKGEAAALADRIRRKFKHLQVGPSMRRQFTRFDKDGNRMLDASEFREVRAARDSAVCLALMCFPWPHECYTGGG